MTRFTTKRLVLAMSDRWSRVVLLCALCNTALALLIGSAPFIVGAALCWASVGCVMYLGLSRVARGEKAPMSAGPVLSAVLLGHRSKRTIEMTLLSELPDNLRLKDGVLSTADGQPVSEYLRGRWANKPAAPEPVVLVSRELFLRMAADHAAAEQQRRIREAERFPLAA